MGSYSAVSCSRSDSINFHFSWRKSNYKRAPRGYFYNSEVFNRKAVAGNRRFTCQLAVIDLLTDTAVLRPRVLTSHRILQCSLSAFHFHSPQNFLWMYPPYPWCFVHRFRHTVSYSWCCRPPVGQGLLIVEDLWSHSFAQQSVGLLWTGDQPDAETSTWQHTTLSTERHTCNRRDTKPQQTNARKPAPRTAPKAYRYTTSMYINGRV